MKTLVRTIASLFANVRVFLTAATLTTNVKASGIYCTVLYKLSSLLFENYFSTNFQNPFNIFTTLFAYVINLSILFVGQF